MLLVLLFYFIGNYDFLEGQKESHVYQIDIR